VAKGDKQTSVYYTSAKYCGTKYSYKIFIVQAPSGVPEPIPTRCLLLLTFELALSKETRNIQNTDIIFFTLNTYKVKVLGGGAQDQPFTNICLHL
jgi:hypothetical protein